MGDTGFEPVTSSVSGQNLCLEMRGSGVSGACAGSLMSATLRVGWPTVWPTANRLPHCVALRAPRYVEQFSAATQPPASIEGRENLTERGTAGVQIDVDCKR